MDVRVKQSLSGNVSSKGHVSALLVCKLQIDGTVGVSTKGVTAQYEGDYEVIPKVTSQVLKTKQKVMTDDLTVKEVPVYEVSNTSGGTTIYIAKE